MNQKAEVEKDGISQCNRQVSSQLEHLGRKSQLLGFKMQQKFSAKLSDNIDK